MTSIKKGKALRFHKAIRQGCIPEDAVSPEQTHKVDERTAKLQWYKDKHLIFVRVFFFIKNLKV